MNKTISTENNSIMYGLLVKTTAIFQVFPSLWLNNNEKIDNVLKVIIRVITNSFQFLNENISHSAVTNWLHFIKQYRCSSQKKKKKKKTQVLCLKLTFLQITRLKNMYVAPDLIKDE